jgi:O-acetyl-ADP-ribose deacetylase (regulator of RNase III)
MPIVKTVKGDLLKMFKDGEFDAIAHGCNCFHTMGSGIAGQISKQFPIALEADKKQTLMGNVKKLGDYTRAYTNHGWIINAYTQYHPGYSTEDVLYPAIESVFTRINKYVAPMLEFVSDTDLNLGIPKIGAGIAGGDWNRIEGIINRVSPRLSITLVEWDR